MSDSSETRNPREDTNVFGTTAATFAEEQETGQFLIGASRIPDPGGPVP